MRHGGEDRHVGSRLQRQMMGGLDMRRAYKIDAAWVDDDQLGARLTVIAAQPLFHPAGEDGVALRGIGADNKDHVGMFDAVEILRARRGAESGLEAVAGGRVADACASIDVVVAEALSDQLLDEEGFLIGTPAGGNAADGADAVSVLDAAELGGDMSDRLFPGNLAPRLVHRTAHHGIENAVAVLGIAPGEATLDAGMAVVGLAFLPGHHAHEVLSAHFCAEGAANAAIGARRDDRAVRRALLDYRVFNQGRGRTCLDTSPAGDAFGREETLVLACRYLAGKAASVDG